MEAKDLRYHALVGKQDWFPPGDPDQPGGVWGRSRLLWDDWQGGLTLRPQFLSIADAPPETAEIRPGGARDADGNWYWIDPSGHAVCTAGARDPEPARFWPAAAPGGPAQPGGFGPRPDAAPAGDLRGLVVTPTQLLVVGSCAPPGLLIFDLLHGGEPRALPLPAGSWPVDLALTPDGSLLVLDGGQQVRYWIFDRFLRPGDTAPAAAPGAFAPAGAAEAPAAPAGLTPDGPACSEISEQRAIAIQALPDGTVLILAGGEQGKPAVVARYRGARRLAAAGVVLPGWAAGRGGDGGAAGLFAPAPYDMVFLAGTLYIVAAGSRECLAFACDLSDERLRLTPRLLYLPMVGSQILGLAAAGGQIYYGTPAGWSRVPSRPCPAYPEQGTVQVHRLDGRQQGCLWHRVLLDAVIAPGTAVRVETRAGDEPELPETIPWSREPDLHLRPNGSELPWHQPFAPDEARLEGAGTWELLLQHAQGRYLAIRLTLVSAPGRAPLVRAARIYYPRLSYVAEYLPQAYQGDQASASFLERFLANMEGIHTDLERRIATVSMLFSPRTAPPQYLGWLAGWYGQMLDAAWDERRQRLFLLHAPELFARRGTLPNLIRLIRLATDREPDEAIFRESVLPYTGLPVPGARPASGFRVVERFWAPAVGLEYGDPAETAWTLPEGSEPATRDGGVIREYREFERNWARIYGPEAMAADGAAVYENFVDQFLPRVRGAHRFTVLVPVLIDQDGVRPALDMEAAAAVIRREKPAHTVAEIRPYLPVMRAGAARVGVDAVVGQGSRLAGLALGSGILGDAYLQPDRRPALAGRLVIGDNQLDRPAKETSA